MNWNCTRNNDGTCYPCDSEIDDPASVGGVGGGLGETPMGVEDGYTPEEWRPERPRAIGFDGSDDFDTAPFMENYEEYVTWSNAGGDPQVVVGGETFDMQPTLTWNRADFFGKQDGGFGASQKESAECNCCRVTNNPRCCHDCRSRDYGGRGLPQGMGVEYREI